MLVLSFKDVQAHKLELLDKCFGHIQTISDKSSSKRFPKTSAVEGEAGLSGTFES